MNQDHNTDLASVSSVSPAGGDIVSPQGAEGLAEGQGTTHPVAAYLAGLSVRSRRTTTGSELDEVFARADQFKPRLCLSAEEIDELIEDEIQGGSN